MHPGQGSLADSHRLFSQTKKPHVWQFQPRQHRLQRDGPVTDILMRWLAIPNEANARAVRRCLQIRDLGRDCCQTFLEYPGEAEQNYLVIGGSYRRALPYQLNIRGERAVAHKSD